MTGAGLPGKTVPWAAAQAEEAPSAACMAVELRGAANLHHPHSSRAESLVVTMCLYQYRTESIRSRHVCRCKKGREGNSRSCFLGEGEEDLCVSASDLLEYR